LRPSAGIDVAFLGQLGQLNSDASALIIAPCALLLRTARTRVLAIVAEQGKQAAAGTLDLLSLREMLKLVYSRV
jgi:hypothetical protein